MDIAFPVCTTVETEETYDWPRTTDTVMPQLRTASPRAEERESYDSSSDLKHELWKIRQATKMVIMCIFEEMGPDLTRVRRNSAQEHVQHFPRHMYL